MKGTAQNISSATKALGIIREAGGNIRTAKAIESGIHPRTLYALRDDGTLEKISRGVYRLAELGAVSAPDLVTVASRFPQAVICLISALSFHNLTTQIPHHVAIAIERGTRIPRIDFPPISVHRFSSQSFRVGVEEHDIDGITVRIYSPEKTIVDSFKFRNKIGMDVVLETLKLYRTRRDYDLGQLLEYSRLCRVEHIMRPYLEATF